MKFLHTSDWHLGHTLYNYERTEEQLAMLNQMAEIVRQEQPDVFMLCGDVYHTAQPSAAVQTMFTNALVNIHTANPSMTIIVAAGNHDSGSKHDIFREPWKALNVHTIGNLERETPNHHILSIPDKGVVVCFPYTHERNIPEGFYRQVIDSAAESNIHNLPIVVMAHTTVRGCDFSGHENATEYTTGGIDAMDAEQFGHGYDYLALGHIHKAQYVHTNKHNVRYCGTPVPVSFDENYGHTVSIVEINQHGDKPIVREIEIINPHPLVTLPLKDMVPFDEAMELLRQFESRNPAYIRLNVVTDDYLPTDANDQADKICKDKNCLFCYINTHRSAKRQGECTELTIQEFQAESPIDMASRYAEDSNNVFDEDMKTLFKEVVCMVDEAERN